MTQRGLSIFRVLSVWTTLALVVFVMWISNGETVGRWISVGVLAFGLIQWLVLRRVSHQMAAKASDDLEQADETP